MLKLRLSVELTIRTDSVLIFPLKGSDEHWKTIDGKGIQSIALKQVYIEIKVIGIPNVV